MRRPIAIILIVCGTLLASAPIVSDFAQAVVVSRALADPAAEAPVFFRQPLEESYRLGCWILGGTMIAVGIIGGCRPRQIPERPRDPAEYFFAEAAR